MITKELTKVRTARLRNEGTALKDMLLWGELMAWLDKRVSYYTSSLNTKGLFDQRAICIASQSQGALQFIGDLLGALRKLETGQSI